MEPHQIEFTWKDKEYTATFKKIAEKKPIFITVYEITPDIFGKDGVMFEIGDSDIPVGIIPQNVFDLDFLNTLWSTILEECKRIDLDIHNLKTY